MKKRIYNINTFNLTAVTKLTNKNRTFIDQNSINKVRCIKENNYYINILTNEKYYILKQNEKGLINKRQADYVEKNLFDKYTVEKVKKMVR